MIQYMKVSPLGQELLDWNQKIEGIAKDEGLDFFETRLSEDKTFIIKNARVVEW